jgi:DNA-binding CsgD family transcriptional regulator
MHWAIVAADLPGDGLTEAEREVLELLAASVRDRLAGAVEASKRPLLSRRERECLQWTAAGKTTWEISAILEISQNTIDGYIATAGRKLGAVNRTQAVAVALRRGLID